MPLTAISVFHPVMFYPSKFLFCNSWKQLISISPLAFLPCSCGSRGPAVSRKPRNFSDLFRVSGNFLCILRTESGVNVHDHFGFSYLENILKTQPFKQADDRFTNGFSGPERSRNFRETSLRSDS